MAENISLEKFSKIFPDQKNWVQRLANRKAKSIASLRAVTGYTGGMELFTMWTCLCSDTDLLGWDPNWIAQNAAPLKRTLHEYRQRHGLPPHPVVLLQQHAAAQTKQ